MTDKDKNACDKPASTKPVCLPLGRGLGDLWRHGQRDDDLRFDVLIVGSGYGGSMAAATLAGQRLQAEDGTSKPLRIGLLERGRQYLPGEFPSRFQDLPAHLRIGRQQTGEITGMREGVFDLRLGNDVTALVANGLGGGSLINAGVMLEPDVADLERELGDEPEVTRAARRQTAKLVKALRDDGSYAAARRMLGGGTREAPNRGVWTGEKALRKTAALRSLADIRGARAPFENPPITVAIAQGPNDANVDLPACTRCGDCMTGCNVGAKDSLDANLLQRAAVGGVEIWTGASVLKLERTRDGKHPCWAVQVVHTDPVLQRRETGPLVLRADKVILAAGTFGSTEILLRSASDSLMFSPALGQGFSCNGDNIAAVYGLKEATGGGEDPDSTAALKQTDCDNRIGPTITGSITLGGGGRRRFLLQEFAVPRAMRRLFEESVTTATFIEDLERDDDTDHGGTRDAQIHDAAAIDTDAIDRTLLVGMIGHDDSTGILRLARPVPPGDAVPEPGGLVVHWPQAYKGMELTGAFDAVAERVASLTKTTDRTPRLVPNLLWRPVPLALAKALRFEGAGALTVHPLGGCRIGDEARNGVVDDVGTVYDARSDAEQERSGDRWQGSLLVLDGSIIPGSLGANPALTIAATALRATRAAVVAWTGKAWPGRVPRYLVAGPEVKTTPAVRRLAEVPGIVEPARVPTKVRVSERLVGNVKLHDLAEEESTFVVELTLDYASVPLEGVFRRRTGFGAEIDVVGGEASTLRIYRRDVWESLGLARASDVIRREHCVGSAPLAGKLRFLHREATTAMHRGLRAWSAWLLNRGAAEGRDKALDRLPSLIDLSRQFLEEDKASDDPGDGALEKFKRWWHLARHAGAVRRFDYELELADALRPVAGKALPAALLSKFAKGARIEGNKRLTYGLRANPWQQLTQLALTRFPGKAGEPAATLEVDLRFFASRGRPLFEISEQQDHARALLDLTSFGLYVARVVGGIHLWSFKMPDPPASRGIQLLPPALPGVPEREVLRLTVDWMRTETAADGRRTLVPSQSSSRPIPPSPGLAPDEQAVAVAAAVAATAANERVDVLLTRYRMNTSVGHPPLVMIHGYSASGTTFAHPSLRMSAAEYFARQGRDVWVLDLRSSAGLPTATLPWAMEQIALVDIPAALMHVHAVTGQRVDVFAHCVGAVMLSMALLADAAEVRSGALQVGGDVRLRDEHLATLDAFNRRSPGEPHPVVRRVVLSQKGPVLDYTDANVFRSYLMQSLRRLLIGPDYRFRPASLDPVLDRLLSTVPYPTDEYDLDNPGVLEGHAPWAAVRHRMDALYGRTFEGRNLSKDTLEAIDDFFGPFNIDTVAQTIHFARLRAAVSRNGRGPFVTLRTLRERWAGIETMSFHGRLNGLVDVGTQRLLADAFARAGVPHVSPDPMAEPFGSLGHQDCLIGQRSEEVFKHVEDFLSDGKLQCALLPGERPTPIQAGVDEVILDLPWIGPRLVYPFDGDPDGVRVAAMGRPDRGEGTLLLVPVRRGTDWAVDPGRPVIHSARSLGNAWMFARPTLPDDATDDPATGWLALLVHTVHELNPASVDFGTSFAAAVPSLRAPPRGARASDDVFRVNVVPTVTSAAGTAWMRARGDAIVARPMDLAAEADAENEALAKALQALGERLDGETCDAIEAEKYRRAAARFIVDHPADWHCALVTATAMRRSEALAPTPVVKAVPDRPFAFALASCQYPAGLLDRTPAQRSLVALAASAAPGAERPVDFALMVGDQIYADATAGLVDPVLADELFDRPSQLALSAMGMRHVLRQIPTAMLLDDHEIVDNWEPLPPAVESRRPLDKVRNDSRRQNGWKAWRLYQNVRPALDMLPPNDVSPGRLAQSFACSGFPFYLLDTRTGRSSRGSEMRSADVGIIDASAFVRLSKWLESKGEALKFVACPSLLLPRRVAALRRVARDAADPSKRTIRSELTPSPDWASERSDAWDGYPASLHKLLVHLFDGNIRNTVFLSGDEHHSLFATVDIVGNTKGGEARTVSLASVHGSPLYAPFPFANGDPRDLIEEETFDLRCDDGRVLAVTVRATFAPPGDGFVRIAPVSENVGHVGGQMGIDLVFVKGDGTASKTWSVRF